MLLSCTFYAEEVGDWTYKKSTGEASETKSVVTRTSKKLCVMGGEEIKLSKNTMSPSGCNSKKKQRTGGKKGK